MKYPIPLSWPLYVDNSLFIRQILTETYHVPSTVLRAGDKNRPNIYLLARSSHWHKRGSKVNRHNSVYAMLDGNKCRGQITKQGKGLWRVDRVGFSSHSLAREILGRTTPRFLT